MNFQDIAKGDWTLASDNLLFRKMRDLSASRLQAHADNQQALTLGLSAAVSGLNDVAYQFERLLMLSSKNYTEYKIQPKPQQKVQQKAETAAPQSQTQIFSKILRAAIDGLKLETQGKQPTVTTTNAPFSQFKSMKMPFFFGTKQFRENPYIGLYQPSQVQDQDFSMPTTKAKNQDSASSDASSTFNSAPAQSLTPPPTLQSKLAPPSPLAATLAPPPPLGSSLTPPPLSSPLAPPPPLGNALTPPPPLGSIVIITSPTISVPKYQPTLTPTPPQTTNSKRLFDQQESMQSAPDFSNIDKNVVGLFQPVQSQSKPAPQVPQSAPARPQLTIQEQLLLRSQKKMQVQPQAATPTQNTPPPPPLPVAVATVPSARRNTVNEALLPSSNKQKYRISSTLKKNDFLEEQQDQGLFSSKKKTTAAKVSAPNPFAKFKQQQKEDGSDEQQMFFKKSKANVAAKAETKPSKTIFDEDQEDDTFFNKKPAAPKQKEQSKPIKNIPNLKPSIAASGPLRASLPVNPIVKPLTGAAKPNPLANLMPSKKEQPKQEESKKEHQKPASPVLIDVIKPIEEPKVNQIIQSKTTQAVKKTQLGGLASIEQQSSVYSKRSQKQTDSAETQQQQFRLSRKKKRGKQQQVVFKEQESAFFNKTQIPVSKLEQPIPQRSIPQSSVKIQAPAQSSLNADPIQKSAQIKTEQPKKVDSQPVLTPALPLMGKYTQKSPLVPSSPSTKLTTQPAPLVPALPVLAQKLIPPTAQLTVNTPPITKSQVKAPQPKAAKSLFDNDDQQDSFFAKKPEKKVQKVQTKAVLLPPKSQQQSQKQQSVPVKAVQKISTLGLPLGVQPTGSSPLGPPKVPILAGPVLPQKSQVNSPLGSQLGTKLTGPSLAPTLSQPGSQPIAQKTAQTNKSKMLFDQSDEDEQQLQRMRKQKALKEQYAKRLGD